MVKRQTVWLSTMMVLSLMLIGYYTMNNGSQTTPSTSTDTSVTNPPVVTTNSSDSNQGTSPASSTSSGDVQASGSDFFVEYQTQVQAQIGKQEDQLLAVINNNNSTTAQISQAEDSLRKLQNLQGNIDNAEEAVKAKGYTDCAIVPNGDGTQMTVWVQAKKHLTTLDAAKIMFAVSQQMGIPMTQINVQTHS